MDIESVRAYCVSLPFVTEDFPFDNTTLVFKVGSKIFALVDVEDFTFINLKSDPEKAVDLRERFEGIKPGYHMNKKHWNSVYIQFDVSEKQLFDLINQSYHLVFDALPKKLKNELTMG
jgi:predicted DNA-binding protein (MmcQ/YjbR family)